MAEAAGPAMSNAANVIGAFSSFYQGNAAADTDMENARRTELAGALQGQSIRDRGRAVSGEAIAAMAANGVQVGSGSSGDLLFQNSLNMEQDVLAARYNAASEAATLRTTAGQKKAAAKGALVGGLLRAGASALSGMDAVGGSDAAMQAQAIEREARLNTQFPGGQKFPIPSHLTGTLSSGYRTSYFGNYGN